MSVGLKTMAMMTNLNWQGDLMDRLTGQNNGFELGETEKKSGKRSRLEPQDKDFSAYALQLFSNNIFFYVYDFSDIDECKGNHSCHVNAACMNTLGSHVCQCHAGYTGNGENCTGKFNLFSTI